MLGIVYAVMGGLSSFLISENKLDVEKKEEKQIVDEDSNSIKPLKVFKLKWFYQVSYINDQTFAFIIHIDLDMDWILQHFHMHGDCRNNIKSFWSDIYQWWPLLLICGYIPKYFEWFFKNCLGCFIWQVIPIFYCHQSSPYSIYDCHQNLNIECFISDSNSRSVSLLLLWLPLSSW